LKDGVAGANGAVAQQLAVQDVDLVADNSATLTPAYLTCVKPRVVQLDPALSVSNATRCLSF